jgi:hypothetical protein
VTGVMVKLDAPPPRCPRCGAYVGSYRRPLLCMSDECQYFEFEAGGAA